MALSFGGHQCIDQNLSAIEFSPHLNDGCCLNFKLADAPLTREIKALQQSESPASTRRGMEGPTK